MITVETPLSSLDREIDLLGRCAESPLAMYAKGAQDALKWVRDGGEPLSTSGCGGLLLVLTLGLTLTDDSHVH